jgi:hypothetical protein
LAQSAQTFHSFLVTHLFAYMNLSTPSQFRS